MIINLLKRVFCQYAFKSGKFRFIYFKLGKPDGREYAEYLKRHGKLHAIGEKCSINLSATITDPEYVSMGNNISLATCTLLGHDGSIAVLNNAYNVKLDSVGKIVIKDNVFIGHGAIIMPGVTIGPNAIVAAGAVVTKDVMEGDVVGGVPARPISRMDDLVHRLQVKTDSLPWAAIISNRTGGFDPSLEEGLIAMRTKFFYPDK